MNQYEHRFICLDFDLCFACFFYDLIEFGNEERAPFASAESLCIFAWFGMLFLVIVVVSLLATLLLIPNND